MSFLKRNKAVIVSMFVLPLLFILILALNYKSILSQANGIMTILIL